MKTSKIRMYGTNWCRDCHRAKQFFHDFGIEFEWIDVDQDPEAEQFVRNINHGKRIVPTIIFEDGSTLVEPSYLQLAEKFEINLNNFE